MKEQILPAEGKLGILLPGLGAVASTMIAGVIASRKGLAKPIGSYTQTGHIELADGKGDNYPLIRDFVPLASLEDIVFGGWDIYEDNVFQAASQARVLDQHLLNAIRPELEAIKPMKAVFDRNYVKNLDGKFIKQSANKWDAAQELIRDIETFKKENNVNRVVIVWTGSTEKYLEQSAVHETIASFEAGLKNNDPAIAPSMVYAYAAVSSGIPFINGAPNLTTDIPAIVQLAQKTKTPIGGKDFKTGQTLMKTIVAPGLAARSLGVTGWFSTNILGNRDGLVLDDEQNFKTKEVSKLGVLEDILRPDLHPDLYGELYHKIRINYYPPHGDNKESWDNIDIFGWLNYPMQIKINFLCRDSILAAPIVLDLALFADLSQRAGMYGVQDWLSFYLKSPQTKQGEPAENDIFKQLNTLKQVLRDMMQGQTQELPAAVNRAKATEQVV
ncbi:inositol-3-phosphate synthase [Niastella yeongjuensis]|uniref:Inositol-3-phosphate synthase n=1 Tax=Niastella yeongjuensis TaxID=354355 RepID=A0A1V9E1J3_9BACT|nr:inositol-3-phosphate synthase [Niastella yeongjuensis]OQP39997.1 inositol-3-phosphate synthase [Niastella yeongjuensis]SEO13006.1 myo-inositol-1-phosphate synthase [Niastella yeongjuensis]